MSDAQREVLRMLSEKVITVDEAERLLKALNDGPKRKEDSRTRGGGFAGFSSAFEALGDTLTDLGPMVKNTIEDVITGLFGEMSGDLNDEHLEEVEPVEGKYRIPEGMQMLLIHDWRGGKGKSDVLLQGVAGEYCGVEEEQSQSLTVQQGASQFVIKWQGGPLNVDIPATVHTLTVRTKNGDITAKGIGCEMALKTLAGNLEAEEIHQDFTVKTMGGNIHLSLSEAWQGKGKAHTMGGNITLKIPVQVSVQADATTMGGTIKVDDSLRELNRKQSFPGRNSVTVQTGEAQSDSCIALKTMGGDIAVRKGHHG